MGWRETLNVHTPERGDTSDKSSSWFTSVTSVTRFGKNEKSGEDAPDLPTPEESPGIEPTPDPTESESGFEGFAGSPSAESPRIESAAYRGILNRTGVRIMALESETAIGVWSDLDGPEIRAALHVRGLDRYPLRYLDGTGVPMPYKLRMVKGDPVPKDVLAEMERNPAEPWKVRDRMLNEMASETDGRGQ
jgi:hypothetical protein